MRKKEKKEVNFDATVFDIGGKYPETEVSLADILYEGTKDEVRHELEFIAQNLKSGRGISEELEVWLGEAIEKIARGEDANKALGLRRKRRITAQEVKNYRYVVNDLRNQGLTKTEALDLVSRYSHKEGAIVDHGNPDSDSAEALRKLLQRY